MPKSASSSPSGKGGTIGLPFTKWARVTRSGVARPGSASSGVGMRSLRWEKSAMGESLRPVYSFDAANRGTGRAAMVRRVLVTSYRAARRIVVATVGATVLAIGLALLVLPGPAFVVIPIGLAILGIEFAWARRWLYTLRSGADAVWRRAGGGAPRA